RTPDVATLFPYTTRFRSDDDDEEAELADGAVGEQKLEVVLGERLPRPEHHGGESEGEQDLAPQERVGVAGGEPRDEVDARLHHRDRKSTRLNSSHVKISY